MLMKLVNIHSFDLKSRAWVLFLILWMLALSSASDLITTEFNIKTAMVISDIRNSVKLDRIHFFISEFNYF